MTSKGFGCTGVVDEAGDLLGIITDGDLRRRMADGLLQQTGGGGDDRRALHHRGRRLAQRSAAADDCAGATDHRDLCHGPARPVGIVHVHDCLRVGLV